MSLVTRTPERTLAELLAPIDLQVPAGLFDLEDELYQAIDQEMVKLGGLHEASIDWTYIEEASCQYLERQCKHLRIVAHLSVAWLRSGCWVRWATVLALWVGLLERYWETAHPKPGPKGFLGKRKLVSLALGRMVDTLPRLDRATYSQACADQARHALSCLHHLQGTLQLDASLLGDLERLLDRHSTLAIAEADTTPAMATAPTAPHLAAAPLPEVIAAPLPPPLPGHERETRRTLLTLAERINQQDPYDPTGYQLRRFGLWAHIQAAPYAAQDDRTELMAIPPDIANGHEEALAQTTIDAALLQRIEKSVTASPYWIRGSFLAASAATRLAMGEVAEAIRATTARFIQRLPALQRLCFSDGTVFVDDQCLAWLRGMPGSSDSGAASPAFASLRDELASQMETGGVEPVLLKLQGMQSALGSPRERCHTTVIAADLLAARGVSWLAQDLCASVARTMQQTTASAWEPEVFQRLQQYGAPQVPDNHVKRES
ncbi:type VI secretion system protein TssA [Pseudomonas alabamensis]|uniref:type VI secretion system protein TssA n=1 Tax=Pseudomonas alabamensis TaxID=3064349 RepID=UPI0021D8AE92|nr:type VI secretion system protein TssA [Pseudomonas entomophila]